MAVASGTALKRIWWPRSFMLDCPVNEGQDLSSLPAYRWIKSVLASRSLGSWTEVGRTFTLAPFEAAGSALISTLGSRCRPCMALLLLRACHLDRAGVVLLAAPFFGREEP